MPPYDKELREQCLQLLRDGVAFVDVSREKGINYWTLRRWADGAGIGRRPKYSEAYRHQQIQRVREGATITQVSLDTGVNYKQLSKWVHNAGLYLKTEYDGALKRQLLARISAGDSIRRVSKDSRVPYPVLIEWCHIAGVLVGGKPRKEGVRGERHKRIAALLKQGLNQSEVAKLTGTHQSWVCRIANRMKETT